MQIGTTSGTGVKSGSVAIAGIGALCWTGWAGWRNGIDPAGGNGWTGWAGWKCWAGCVVCDAGQSGAAAGWAQATGCCCHVG